MRTHELPMAIEVLFSVGRRVWPQKTSGEGRSSYREVLSALVSRGMSEQRGRHGDLRRQLARGFHKERSLEQR